MAERKAYRDTRTGAVRRTAGALGFPYVELTAAEARELAKEPTATDAQAEGGAKGKGK